MLFERCNNPSPCQLHQLTDRRCVSAGRKASKNKASQLSKSGRVYCEVDQWICVRIWQRICGFGWRLCWRKPAAIFYWSCGFCNGFVAAADFSNGASQPTECHRKRFTVKSPASMAHIYKTVRTGWDPNKQWANARFSAGMPLVN